MVGAGSGTGILTSLPFPVLGLVPGVGHLLYEVQGHLGVDLAGRMEGVQGLPCPEGLLHLLPATAGAANQLNAVQYDSWLQLLFEQEFQFRQIRNECRKEFWVLEVGDDSRLLQQGPDTYLVTGEMMNMS